MAAQHDHRDDPAGDAGSQAQGDLEQVGCILERLELGPADIVRLRTETRAVLAGLAA